MEKTIDFFIRKWNNGYVNFRLIKRRKYMLKKFIQYYKPYKKLFILDMMAALLFSICDLIYPIITRNIMN